MRRLIVLLLALVGLTACGVQATSSPAPTPASTSTAPVTPTVELSLDGKGEVTITSGVDAKGLVSAPAGQIMVKVSSQNPRRLGTKVTLELFTLTHTSPINGPVITMTADDNGVTSHGSGTYTVSPAQMYRVIVNNVPDPTAQFTVADQ